MYTSKRNTLWSALLLLIQFLSKGRVSVRVFQPPQFQWPRYAPAFIHPIPSARRVCLDTICDGIVTDRTRDGQLSVVFTIRTVASTVGVPSLSLSSNKAVSRDVVSVMLCLARLL